MFETTQAFATLDLDTETGKLAQPVELSLEELAQVSGGSPHGTWGAAEASAAQSPHGTW